MSIIQIKRSMNLSFPITCLSLSISKKSLHSIRHLHLLLSPTNHSSISYPQVQAYHSTQTLIRYTNSFQIPSLIALKTPKPDINQVNPKSPIAAPQKPTLPPPDPAGEVLTAELYMVVTLTFQATLDILSQTFNQSLEITRSRNPLRRKRRMSTK